MQLMSLPSWKYIFLDAYLLYKHKINSNILLVMENVAILRGSFNKDTYKKEPKKELVLLNLPLYNFIRCAYWKISSTLSFPVWPPFAISFHNFFTFLLSFLLFLCLFSLSGSYLYGFNCILFCPFHCSISSPIKSNADPMPQLFCSLGQTYLLLVINLGFSPAFHSSPLIWSPLHLHHIHHLHVYCYLELFLESQLHFSHDLEPLNSLWPAPFSWWLCWTPGPTWQSFCCSFLLSHSPICNNQLLLLDFYRLIFFPLPIPSYSLSSLHDSSVTHCLPKSFRFDLYFYGNKNFYSFLHVNLCIRELRLGNYL